MDLYKMSEATQMAKAALEIEIMGEPISRHAEHISRKLVVDVWQQAPALFGGKQGGRPHGISVAAAALALGVRSFSAESDGHSACYTAMGLVLRDIERNQSRYKMANPDFVLVRIAQDAFLEFGQGKIGGDWASAMGFES
ncbi:hypothetical protein FJQ54_07245 [Sandaracinobacter neustonicus]|uniref:MmgE/PrpD family protein n=1 Tax=Sandaracinobacter neustonicus TaxID=1715348 RepID=A0A501XP69_9SPHN|nr:hypothetical protein [Sandaracinobacter neustonicus]TPE62310.1 hypothetical protein FJQ54_07245 [Sandaracinobacter neustonicus]